MRELVLRVERGELRGVPSAHVIRLSASGMVSVEGPMAADSRAVARAAHLLDTLLPPFNAPRRASRERFDWCWPVRSAHWICRRTRRSTASRRRSRASRLTIPKAPCGRSSRVSRRRRRPTAGAAAFRRDAGRGLRPGRARGHRHGAARATRPEPLAAHDLRHPAGAARDRADARGDLRAQPHLDPPAARARVGLPAQLAGIARRAGTSSCATRTRRASTISLSCGPCGRCSRTWAREREVARRSRRSRTSRSVEIPQSTDLVRLAPAARATPALGRVTGCLAALAIPAAADDRRRAGRVGTESLEGISFAGVRARGVRAALRIRPSIAG